MMFRLFFITLFLLPATVPAQNIPWKALFANKSQQILRREALTSNEKRRVRRVVAASHDELDCDDEPSWTRELLFQAVSLGSVRTTLVQGMGCNRVGPGSNAVMWIVRWSGDQPVLIGELQGFFNHVEQNVSHGMHDFTVGWRQSAASQDLELFRFDGKSYKSIGSASQECTDDEGHCTITPNNETQTN